jgi:hypothetical protein
MTTIIHSPIRIASASRGRAASAETITPSAAHRISQAA